ncbi:MAG: NAD-dependent epimerase [Betaproteobacteria bacterium]|nr:NAD-dependent epimerase [Betaproteobacteria bacterium]
MTTLVTGAAGFIGMHLAERLLAAGEAVIGIDNLNAYYDPKLKQDRLARLLPHRNFTFKRVEIADPAAMKALFTEHRIRRIVHLAAQAGVRHSFNAPQDYIDANITGFLNVLEMCRHHGIEHLIYASSSSVYGANSKLPFSEHDSANHPVSLYAATKRANELMAHTYSHLFGFPVSGLRFFTAYGPWGRPDMSLFLFTKAILQGDPIQIFNHGDMQRDFTFVDDIVEGVVRLLPIVPVARPGFQTSDPAASHAPFRVYNIGNNNPVPLMRFIEVLEQALGREAIKIMKPMQPGDVQATYADINDLNAVTGFAPRTSIEEGIARFVAWYRAYYQVPAST